MNLFRIHSVLDGIRKKTLTHDSKRRLVWSAVFEDGMTAAQIYADPELAVYASGMDIVLDRWIRVHVMGLSLVPKSMFYGCKANCRLCR